MKKEKKNIKTLLHKQGNGFLRAPYTDDNAIFSTFAKNY